MAEIGQGNQQTKPIAGHSGDSEVALYTRQADQARMPSAAMRALVAWEASNQEIRLDTNEQKSLNINFLYPALVGPAPTGLYAIQSEKYEAVRTSRGWMPPPMPPANRS